MKVAFYIEPFYEFDSPKFRIPTINSIIKPIVNIIKDEFEVSIITSKQTIALTEKLPDFINVISIDASIYKKYFKSSLEYACQLQKKEFNSITLNNLATEIKCIIKNYNPDIVINYESASTPLLSMLFKKAKIINMMFGPFSRVPFPATTFIDTMGIYNNSLQTKIQNRTLSFAENECLRVIRNRTMLCIAENYPCRDLLARFENKYEKLIIVACQVDNYFGFKTCCDFETSFDVIINVLKQVPQNYGIIVTSHGEFDDQYSKDQIEEISFKYPNCEFVKTNIPYITQFLLPFSDCLVTASSSLGFQSIFWGKPLFLSGNSHLTPLSCGKITDNTIYETLNKNKTNNKDGVLYEILSKHTFFDKYDIINREFINILKKVVNNESLTISQSPKTLTNKFINSFRGLSLKNIFKERNIETIQDHLMVNACKHSYISFDVFDTLVSRPITEPWHLFLLIQNNIQNLIHDLNFNFTHFRRLAEANIRRYSGTLEVTIEEIYEEFHKITGLCKETCSKIMNIEINTEQSICFAKKSIQKKYDLLKLLKTSIFIISDIYLHTETIEKILKNTGYSGWTKIYCSSDTKYRKHDGKLFNFITKINNIKNTSSWLHIGDNPIADLQKPREYGLHAYQIPSSKQQYDKSFIKNYLSSNIDISGIGGSIVSSLIINRYFGNSYNNIRKECAFDGDPSVFGYSCIGPMILGFVQWVHRKAIKNHDKFLYFLARDGWLPQKAYNIIFQNKGLPNKYLYASRRAVSVPSINNISDIMEIAFQSFDARPLEAFLSNRFGININDIPKETYAKHSLNAKTIISPIRYMPELRAFLEDISDIIINKANEEKLALFKYFEDINLFKNLNAGRVGFVDIGYSGSMQKYISKITHSTSIDGMYYLTHFHSRYKHKNENIDGFFGCEDDHRCSYRHKLNDYVFLFESVLSSPEGSLASFTLKNNKINANYLYDINEQQRVKTLNKIHLGALNFITDISKLIDTTNIESFDISANIASRIILEFAKNPCKKDAEIFFNIGIENLYGGGSVCLIEKSLNEKPSSEEIEALIRRSKWKEGCQAIYSPQKTNKIENSQITKDTNLTDISKNQIVSLNKSKNERLLLKLKNNPKAFFSESKYFLLRFFSHILFTKYTKNNLGSLCVNITQKFLTKK